MNAEQLAKAFHERYERVALEEGYSTRTESRTSWENVPEVNKRVMIKTCESILSLLGVEADLEEMDAAGLSPDAKPWYCPACRERVPWNHVTNEEKHDPRVGGCGKFVRPVSKPLDVINDCGGVERIAEAQAAAREKFDAEHDDAHVDGELALAAIAYAAPVCVYVIREHARGLELLDPFPWPGAGNYDARFGYGERRYNPGNVPPDPKTFTAAERLDLLAKAGGFIASEIDRIIRAEGGSERIDAKAFECPSRNQPGPWERGALDVWDSGRWAKAGDKWPLEWRPRACSFCGGVHPEDALRLIDEGWEVELTRKPHKVYLHPPGFTAAMRDTLKGVRERGVEGLVFPDGYVEPVPPVKGYGPHFAPEQLARLNRALGKQREKGSVE